MIVHEIQPNYLKGRVIWLKAIEMIVHEIQPNYSKRKSDLVESNVVSLKNTIPLFKSSGKHISYYPLHTCSTPPPKMFDKTKI